MPEWFGGSALNNPSVEGDFNFYRVYNYFEVVKKSAKNPEKWFLAFEDQEIKEIRKYEFWDLVNRVYDLWVDFLKENNLV